MKIKNVICRSEDIISCESLKHLYPYGVEIIENELSILDKKEIYDCFLVVLDDNGDIEGIYDTKKEALNSWLSLYNKELIESL